MQIQISKARRKGREAKKVAKQCKKTCSTPGYCLIPGHKETQQVLSRYVHLAPETFSRGAAG